MPLRPKNRGTVYDREKLRVQFGPDGQIVLIEYYEAAYLKDDIDDIRILFTGFRDKQKARDEVKQLLCHHEHKTRIKFCL